MKTSTPLLAAMLAFLSAYFFSLYGSGGQKFHLFMALDVLLLLLSVVMGLAAVFEAPVSRSGITSLLFSAASVLLVLALGVVSTVGLVSGDLYWFYFLLVIAGFSLLIISTIRTSRDFLEFLRRGPEFD